MIDTIDSPLPRHKKKTKKRSQTCFDTTARSHNQAPRALFLLLRFLLEHELELPDEEDAVGAAEAADTGVELLAAATAAAVVATLDVAAVLEETMVEEVATAVDEEEATLVAEVAAEAAALEEPDDEEEEDEPSDETVTFSAVVPWRRSVSE